MRLSLLWQLPGIAIALFTLVGCDGDDAGTCTITQGDDGTAVIRCPDATEHVLQRGEDGPTGPDGPRGPSSSERACTLTEGPDNAMTLTCGEETVVIGETCNEGFPGSLYVDSYGEYSIHSTLLHFELSGCTRVNGDVIVEHYTGEALPHVLNRITHIDGDLIIGNYYESDGNPQLQEARLSQLREVQGGIVIVAGDGLINGVDFPRLERVEGWFDIAQSNALERLGDLSSLRHAGSINVYGNDALKEFSGLSSLETVEDGLNIDGNGALTYIEAPARLHSAGTVKVYNNNALTTVTPFTALSNLGELIWTQNNIIEGLADFPALARVGTVMVHVADTLHSLDGLANLRVVEGLLSISGLPSLVSLAPLDNLEAIHEQISIDYNESLSDAEIQRFLDALSFEPEGRICDNAGTICLPEFPQP